MTRKKTEELNRYENNRIFKNFLIILLFMVFVFRAFPYIPWFISRAKCNRPRAATPDR